MIITKLDNVGQKFDLIIVGSSPLSMLEAILAKRSGKTVCLIERNDRLGGAWLTEDALNLTDIETTPHLFVPEQSAYRILDEYLDGQFQDLPQQPQLLVTRSGLLLKKAIIPMSKRLNVIGAMFMTEYIDNRRKSWPKRISKGLKFLYRQIVNNHVWSNAGKAKYPKHGLSKWYQRIEQKLANEQINLKLNTAVKTIELRDKECCLELENGGVLKATQVMVNRHAVVQFQVDGRIIDIAPPKKNYSNHFTFIVKNAEPMPFVQAIGNSDLMLFNDVTDFANDLGQKYPGCRLITMRTNSTSEPTDFQPEKYFGELKKLGLLKDSVELVKFHTRQICTNTHSMKSVQTVISESSGAIDFLLAGDLGIMSSISRRYSKNTNENAWRQA